MMLLTYDKTALSKCVDMALRGCAKRSNLPILSMLHCSVTEDGLRITGTDRELAITVRIPLMGCEAGAAVLPGAALSEMLRSLPAGEARLQVDDRNVGMLTCGKSKFTLHGLPAEEYPFTPQHGEQSFTVSARSWRELCRRTGFAISNDKARPVFTGMYCHLDSAGLHAAGTDTHRLAHYVLPYSGPPISFILPDRGVDAILRVLDDKLDMTVEIGKALTVTIGGVTVQSRLIEGTFPDYQRIFDQAKAGAARFTADRALLLAAVKRILAVARATEGNKVVLERDGELLVLTASAASFGEAREEVPATWHHDSLRTAFNAAYLVDVLEICSGEAVQFAQGSFAQDSADGPGLFLDTDAPSWDVVVMPQRLE
jgi:DNA polymerase III subunit beta